MVKTISVLIPTYGREKEVIDTVQALLHQTRVPDEIVVVDQNADAFPALDRFLDSTPIVRHVKAPNPGVSINYNRCLEHATGDVVLYLDDDVIPDPKLVEMHLKHYLTADLKSSRLGGVAGRVEQPSGDPDPKTIQKMGVYHPWSGTITAQFNAIRPCEVEIAPGGNMSFLRKILLETGGFDEGFGGNGYFFETDGSLRVHQAGYKILFDPEAQIKHLMAPAGGARVSDKATHTYHFVRNGIRLYRRHSPVLALPVCYLRMIFYFVAKAAYNLNLRIFINGLFALTDGTSQSMTVKSAFTETK